jgi:hypothetical protein
MTTCCYINSGQSNFEFEYLGEFETEFENILGYKSGAQVCSFDGRKKRAKISCYFPFKGLTNLLLFRLVFWLFRLFRNTETPCFDIKAKQPKQRLVSDSAETSFGSSFGCFDTKLVSEDTLDKSDLLANSDVTIPDMRGWCQLTCLVIGSIITDNI